MDLYEQTGVVNRHWDAICEAITWDMIEQAISRPILYRRGGRGWVPGHYWFIK